MVELPAFGAVIFDMDGLLLDNEHIARQAWKQAGEAAGYDITDEVFLQVVGRNLRDTERLFKAMLGDDFPFHDIRQLRLRIGADYIARHGLPLKPGVVELLSMLHERTIPRAVATSTDHAEAWRRLHLTGLSQYFDILCGGDEVARGKPEPDLFLLAAERLGVAATTCIVLEDSEYGIRAASRAGMIPLWIPDLKPPSDQAKGLAHAICASLHDVRAAMEAVLHRRQP